MHAYSKYSLRNRLIVLVSVVFCVLLMFGCFTNALTSNELEERRTETSTGYRIDYVDDLGNIIFAENKGYASIVVDVENDLKVAEHYFDASGEPVAVGNYYGVLYSYAGSNCIQVIYVDENECPTLNNSRYAIRRMVYDSNGNCIKETYFDVSGEAVATWDGSYGKIREYNSDNRATLITYIDADGNPMVISHGYATIHRIYNDDGTSLREFYFDTEGNPATSDNGQYGEEYIRDESGSHLGTIYLDADGNIMMNNRGYAIVRYVRDDLNRVVRWSYFDESDNPIEIGRGYHSETLMYEGNQATTRSYYDLEGNKLFFLDEFLRSFVWVNLILAIVILIVALFVPKPLKVVAFIGYLGFILYMTMFSREGGDMRYNLDLIETYKHMLTSVESRNEILNNVFFFVPLGGLTYYLWPKKKSIVISAFVTLLIEFTQLFTHLGTFELNDLIGNFLGGVIGMLVAMALIGVNNKVNKKKLEGEQIDG